MTTDESTASGPAGPTRPLTTATVVLIAASMVLAVTVISVAIFVAAERDDSGDAGTRASGRTASVTVTDDFVRADGDDLTSDASPWEQVSGVWTADGAAHLQQPNPNGPRTLAILPGVGADGTLSITAESVGPGWAVAFRARDQLNYVALVARPADGSWALERVTGGQVSQVPRVVASTPSDGDRIEIDLDGSAVTVSINDTSATVDLAVAPGGDAGAGLLVIDGAPADLAWTDFSFTGRATTDIPIVTVGPR